MQQTYVLLHLFQKIFKIFWIIEIGKTWTVFILFYSNMKLPFRQAVPRKFIKFFLQNCHLSGDFCNICYKNRQIGDSFVKRI